MTINECFYLGKITKIHGIKGECQIYLDVDNPNEYEEMESVFVEINKNLVPFFIEKIDVKHGGQAVVKFEGINKIEEVSSIINNSLFLPIEVLPKLKGNKFYFHEVIGFGVIDTEFGPIGNIKNIIDHPLQNILELDFNGVEVLVPVNNEIIKNVDRKNKTIEVVMPAGLLDVYLSNDKNEEPDDWSPYEE